MESFHNDMILMVQMFAAMHKEHLASVRGELDRVEQLTRELVALQEKLNRSSAEEEGASSSPPSIPASRERLAAGGGVESDAAPSPGRKPPRAPSDPRHVKPAPRPGRRAPDAADASPPRQEDSTDLKKPLRASNPEAAHSFLTERITMLQRERQGYWRRIISLIGG
jgi:hypothetical protein